MTIEMTPEVRKQHFTLLAKAAEAVAAGQQQFAAASRLRQQAYELAGNEQQAANEQRQAEEQSKQSRLTELQAQQFLIHAE